MAHHSQDLANPGGRPLVTNEDVTPAVPPDEVAGRSVDGVALGVRHSLERLVVLLAVRFDDQPLLGPEKVGREAEHAFVDSRSREAVPADHPMKEGDLEA